VKRPGAGQGRKPLAKENGMNEGWIGDEYLILFAEHEQAEITKAYNLERYLP